MINISLFSMISVALGNTEPSNLPSVEDWEALLQLAQRQGVIAIAYDGLIRILKESKVNTEVPRRIVSKWTGYAINAENKYQSYCSSLQQLISLLEKNGIEPLVMKGYGCSLNWPVPEHRPMGDIDLFCNDPLKLDQFVESQLHLELDRSDSHHTMFTFNGILVENHHSVLNIHTHKPNAEMEPLLRELSQIPPKQVTLGDATIRIPSVKFNSIHLLRHMESHFPGRKMTLRHVLDWATFIHSAGEEMDWAFVYSTAHRFKMNSFLDALNGICVKYLGYPAEIFPIEHPDEKLRDKILNAILEAGTDADFKRSTEYSNPVSLIFSRMAYCWRNRWKTEMVFGEGAAKSFCRMAWGYWKEKHKG